MRSFLASSILFADLLLVALLVGTMFGIWLGFNPAGLSASAYVEVQQQTIRSLNTPMPSLGAVCIALNLALSVIERASRPRSILFLGAALCLLVAGLITRFENQPINGLVMTWSSQSPPDDWAVLRDRWWRWHVFRTMGGIAALLLLIGATLLGRGQNRSDRAPDLPVGRST